jgi:hypothetical protein
MDSANSNPNLDDEATRLANSTITALIDMGYVLSLGESFAIKDRIAFLLEEDGMRPGRNIVFRNLHTE